MFAKRAFILMLAVLAGACGGGSSSPTSPTIPDVPAGRVEAPASTTTVPPPAAKDQGQQMLVLVNGDNSEPVIGGTVNGSGPNEKGQFGSPLAASPLTATAPGFLRRDTMFSIGMGTLGMWPVSPAGESFVHQIVYVGAEGIYGPQMSRIDADVTYVVPSADFWDDPQSIEGIQGGSVEASRAIGIQFLVVRERPTSGVVFPLVAEKALGPGHVVTGYSPDSSGRIPGGSIAFGSIETAYSPRLVAHELGHAFGLKHTERTAVDMMAQLGGAHSYNADEELVARMMRRRMPGSTFPDNDRPLAAPASRPHPVRIVD